MKIFSALVMAPIIGILLYCQSPQALAAPETRFVRHQPSIPLVSDPGAEAVIVKRLTPGEIVTVLGEQGDFVNVSSEGTSGWVRNTDLTTELPPSRLVEQAQSELAASEEKVSGLEREVASLQQQLRSARANARNAQQDLEATESSQTEELNETKLRVDELSEQLQQANTALEESRQRISELEMARSASKLLAQTPARSAETSSALFGKTLVYSIGAGAGLFVLGLLLGILWRNRQLRKRYYGMEL